uniref:hypothetical protein n=1 Tax=Salmonella sp. s29873 TaxID=3159634 RepID=UPI00397F5ECC
HQSTYYASRDNATKRRRHQALHLSWFKHLKKRDQRPQLLRLASVSKALSFSKQYRGEEISRRAFSSVRCHPQQQTELAPKPSPHMSHTAPGVSVSSTLETKKKRADRHDADHGQENTSW